MAIHSFAKLDDNNLVLTTLAVDDADCNFGDEATGISFLSNLTGWSKWKLIDPAQKGIAIGGTFDESDGDFKPNKPRYDYVWNSEYKIWRYPDDIAAGKLPE